MFAQQNTSAHAPSIALLEEGRTSPARPTETTPCLTTEMTVADPGALAGHPQLKAPGQHATNGAQRGARTHDPEIKSLMLYRLSPDD